MQSSMNGVISIDSTVAATTEQVSCELSGEAVILNLKDSVYYGLNEVGAVVWSLIQQPRRVAEVRDAVVAEYAVEPEVCERDVIGLLERLAERGLVEVVDATI